MHEHALHLSPSTWLHERVGTIFSLCTWLHERVGTIVSLCTWLQERVGTIFSLCTWLHERVGTIFSLCTWLHERVGTEGVSTFNHLWVLPFFYTWPSRSGPLCVPCIMNSMCTMNLLHVYASTAPFCVWIFSLVRGLAEMASCVYHIQLSCCTQMLQQVPLCTCFFPLVSGAATIASSVCEPCSQTPCCRQIVTI